MMLLYVGWLKRFPFTTLAGLALIFGFLVYSSGVSRIYQQEHWPSDVLGGYILGVLGPLIFIPVYHRLERIRWLTPPRVGLDIAGSYGSAVVIEPAKGVATKYFDPPVLIHLLYRISFQHDFPYVSNTHALEAAVQRRRIAGFLTSYWFRENLVSQIIRVDWHNGKAALVTEFVPGSMPENNTEAFQFLSTVSTLFDEAGLPGWQLNPRNPHAHTNLVRRPDGRFVIVDMESGFVTPFPAPGRVRPSMKHGTLPVFDDIDFERLASFISQREPDLLRTLGEDGYVELLESAEKGQSAYNSWHRGEPRIWGRAVGLAYRALNIRADFAAARRGVAGAQHRAVAFLDEGVSTWQSEGRITPQRADSIRESLRDPGISIALEHLGAHLMISAVFRFPFGSILRPLWTLIFMVRALDAVARRRPNRTGGLDIHNPVVLAWAVIQVARKAPLKLYKRTRIDRWLPPPRPY
jgi:hypothetical protein